MIRALVEASRRLAAAIREENAALGALELRRVAEAARSKAQAVAAYEAARTAAAKVGAKAAPGAEKDALVAVTEDLRLLAKENGRLLEDTLRAQSRVVDIIAKVAAPATGVGVRAYGPPGCQPSRLPAEALAIRVKA